MRSILSAKRLSWSTTALNSIIRGSWVSCGRAMDESLSARPENSCRIGSLAQQAHKPSEAATSAVASHFSTSSYACLSGRDLHREQHDSCRSELEPRTIWQHLSGGFSYSRISQHQRSSAYRSHTQTSFPQQQGHSGQRPFTRGLSTEIIHDRVSQANAILQVRLEAVQP